MSMLSSSRGSRIAGNDIIIAMAIDDCTGLRVLGICDKNNRRKTIQFIEYTLTRLTTGTEVIQTDNVLRL